MRTIAIDLMSLEEYGAERVGPTAISELESEPGLFHTIDVDPDDRYIVSWSSVYSSFAYKKFVMEGDEEPVGRLTYSIAAMGV